MDSKTQNPSALVPSLLVRGPDGNGVSLMVMVVMVVMVVIVISIWQGEVFKRFKPKVFKHKSV